MVSKMTRWTDPRQKKESTLLGMLPGIESNPENLKSSNFVSSSCGKSTDADLNNKPAPESTVTSTSCSDEAEVTSTSTITEDGPSCVTSTDVCSLTPVTSSGIRDVYKTPIPLPPPASTFSVGNACGGNQSYVTFKDTMSRLHEKNRAPSPDMTGGIFRSTPNHHSDRPPGVVGLTNLGNTCFMNSGLQCLINTPTVVEFFLKSSSINGFASFKVEMVAQFQNLINNAWNGSSPSLHLNEFKSVLGTIFSQFKDTRQHDCQEFLALTLDALHEQLKTYNARKHTNEPSSSYSTLSGTCDRQYYRSFKSTDRKIPCRISNGEFEKLELEKGSKSPENKRRRISSAEETAVCQLDDDESALKSNSADLSLTTQSELSAAVVFSHMHVSSSDNSVLAAKSQAEEFWSKYIQENNTVVGASFQGMYKSTVTCSVCKYISRTYEPFMYLSLPIPRTAEQRQLTVTFSSYKDQRPIKVDLSINMSLNVGKLKSEVLEKLAEQINSTSSSDTYIVAEVSNYNIYRVLSDEIPLRAVLDSNKNIYVYELNLNFEEVVPTMYGPSLEHSEASAPEIQLQDCSLKSSNYTDDEWEKDCSPMPQISTYEPVSSLASDVSLDVCNGEDAMDDNARNLSSTHIGNIQWIQCAVCLEDFLKTELRQHYRCACILCVDCMKKTASHFECNGSGPEKTSESAPATRLKCPVCAVVVDYEKSFLPLDEPAEAPAKKMMLVPLLFRHDPQKDSNNNSPVISRLFSHPWILKLPSFLPSTELYAFILSINPFPDHSFRLLNASWNGTGCDKCVYKEACGGCELPMDGIISLNSRHSLVIAYSGLSTDLVASVEPPDMVIHTGLASPWAGNRREEPPIDIHECLNAFSEIEHLDEQNPWYCPECKKNQCATKALTICRFPDYLIVYLKRFVFLENSSNKLNNRLKFPVVDLDVSPYIAEEFAGSQHIYDLYSCVCHFGNASAGHYIAYGKNPSNGAWHCFNDETVSPKTPSEHEFSSAYVLFYERKGLKSDIPIIRRNASQRFRYTSSSLEDGAFSTAANAPPSPSDSFLKDVKTGASFGSLGVKISAETVSKLDETPTPTT